ncbi:hypothetical protein RFI_21290 [Reticulomyxa filosa]|uniref:Uncharacterized protein n=1 Tax=Reticulomyxa filosa TaxID=46433 RepID=X6MPY4_RETFI|nr:hypothetical protein RFI_21290 [Reticulomyxa filosa]|eukprot:ETO16068.1 hypothetical protein RFI_21290 [Reticulomyxa filosa]
MKQDSRRYDPTIEIMKQNQHNTTNIKIMKKLVLRFGKNLFFKSIWQIQQDMATIGKKKHNNIVYISAIIILIKTRKTAAIANVKTPKAWRKKGIYYTDAAFGTGLESLCFVPLFRAVSAVSSSAFVPSVRFAVAFLSASLSIAFSDAYFICKFLYLLFSASSLYSRLQRKLNA